MKKIICDFSLNQKISSGLSMLLVMLLGLIVAWYSVSAAEKIIKEAPESNAFNLQKRINNSLNNKQPANVNKIIEVKP
jgi:hypothetical protein